MSGFVRTLETAIDAPADRVFAYLSDFTRHPEWADQAMTIEHVSGPATGPGATFKTHVDIALPVGHTADDATVVVVESVAPKLLAYECTDSGGHYRWTVDLAAAGDQTHVTQRVQRLDAPMWVKVVQPMLWRIVGHKQVGNGLANLKERLETA